MSANNQTAVSWDPYNTETWKNPYPMFRRMREEAPLYYNEEHDFYALSRFEDVNRGLEDRETFSSARGGIIEIIKANAQLPEAVFIFQDPPVHTAFRGLMQRVITPKRMNALEVQIRDFCAKALDPVVGADRFDFIANLGAEMPMRVIGMLLGIPEEDQKAVRQMADTALFAEAGKPMAYNPDSFTGDAFEEYIEWRTKNPSDDLMTELLNAEFKDPVGVLRKLRRDELLMIVNMFAGAGNETTNRLIGWAGKVLAEHPAQRHELAKNPGLIPQAIEELLRFEPPGPAIARVLTRDIELHGKKLREGSIVTMIVASANRDDRRFADGDAFNIHREKFPHLGFGRGIHACIGAPLARLEGRVALEEVLKRFTDWEVDYDHAHLSATTTVRGWDTLPVYTRPSGKRSVSQAMKGEAAMLTTKVEAPATSVFTVEGTWNLTVKSPTGAVNTVLVLERAGDALTGTQTGQGTTSQIADVKLTGNKIYWVNHITKPMKMKVEFTGEIDGNSMSGKSKAGFMGSFAFTASKA